MKFDVYILHAAKLKTSLGRRRGGDRSFGGEKKEEERRKKATNKKMCIKQRWLWKRCRLETRWWQDELARLPLPSGCYHCYKCSGSRKPSSPLSFFFFFLWKNTNKRGAAPTQMSSCCVAPLFFIPPFFSPWQQCNIQIEWLEFP